MSVGSVRSGLVTVVAILALGTPRTLTAQNTPSDANHLYDRFQAAVNFTTVLNWSNVRVDASNGPGTTLDYKSLLGISGTSIQPALGVKWKPGRHTELDLGYQFLNQSGQRAFTDSLVIGDDTLSGNLDLRSKIGESNATLQFKYSLWPAERHNIGLALGLGAVFLRMDFTGTAQGCAAASCDSTGAFGISRSVTAPIASLGAFGRWRLGDRWYVGGDARGLGARVDRYQISVLEADAGAEYYLSDRWGLQLGWYYTDVTVNVAPKSEPSAADFSGKVAYNYSSIRLGVISAF
jgi:hypothetical protein